MSGIAKISTKIKTADISFLQKAFFSNFQKNSNSHDSFLSDTLVQNIPQKPCEKKLILSENDPTFAFDFDHINIPNNSDNKLPLNGIEPSENEPKGADEYTLNVGRAIRTLRSELSSFFEQGLKDTSIYSQNILLSDPHHTRLHVRGKHVYMGIANLLRWSLIWYFDDLTLEISKINVVGNNTVEGNDPGQDIYFKGEIFNVSLDWKSQNDNKLTLPKDTSYKLIPLPTLLAYSTSSLQPSDRNTRLFIRWTLEGTPRSYYISSMLSSHSTRIPRSTFSGIFMYKFDSKTGLVSEHHVRHIVPAPSRRAVLYQGFGGLGGLLWRIRSGMRQQKNEWGVGLGMLANEFSDFYHVIIM
ncbi:9865_t:CDS:2 [Diversispora eburnea]|uniref:9865_t:CDS:1 n=1 Tax=Diversispora eburnea TaxID=1213867 RepID=A0A9N8YJN4_9GLOM|nr:9865_t:CDS:2 [Diversispora eburnea]